MKGKRRFKISKELKPYIRLALARQRTPFCIKKEGDNLYVEVPLSGERFHKIVLRARCEKLTKETGTVHLTREEADDALLRETLLPGGGTFVIIGKENQS